MTADAKNEGDVLVAHRHECCDDHSTQQLKDSTQNEYASSDDLAEELESAYLAKEEQASIPPGYFIREGGLYCAVSKKANGNDEGVDSIRIGDALHVVAAVSTKNGGEQARVVQFHERTRNIDKTVTISLELLVKDGNEMLSLLVREGYICSLDRNSKSKIADYIMRANPPQLRLACSCTGWIGDDFVLPTGVISASEKQELLFTGSSCLEGFTSSGTIDGWKEKVSSKIFEYPALIFSICAALAAPLLRVLKVPCGGFHLYGTSGAGKTTALKLAASVLGAETLVGTWRSTSNGLEAVSEVHNDLVLPLDEIYQIDPIDLPECIYLIANGRGRQRANRQGNRRVPKQWNVLVLSCGEAAIGDVCQKLPEGARNRLVDIEFGGPIPTELCRGLHQAIKEEYGTALPYFLRHIIGEKIHIQEDWLKFREHFLKEMPGIAVPDRVETRLAVVAYAGHVAYQCGVLPFDPRMKLIEFYKKGLLCCQDSFGETQIIDHVRKYILSVSNKIYSLQNQYPRDEAVGVIVPGEREGLGTLEERSGNAIEYVLFPAPLKKYLSNVGLSLSDVMQVLEKQGFLGDPESGRGRQKRVYYPPLNSRLSGYPVLARIFDE
jgi:putative DNA primase/helicase